jgi:hypothetical protein
VSISNFTYSGISCYVVSAAALDVSKDSGILISSSILGRKHCDCSKHCKRFIQRLNIQSQNSTILGKPTVRATDRVMDLSGWGRNPKATGNKMSLRSQQDRQFTLKSKTDVRSHNHFCCGKAICISHFGCVFVALVIQNAQSMRHLIPSVACLSLQYFSTLSNKRYDFRKNVIECEIYVLIFFTTFI